MKYVVSYDEHHGFQRQLEQPLTKTMQHGSGYKPGFGYDSAPRKDAKVTRLVVNIADLETAINSLIAEGNRYYYLYCYPY